MKFIFLFVLLYVSSFAFAQKIETNFYPFKDEQGWGVKKANGVALFSERYDSVLVSNSAPYRNKIRVRRNEKWGVVDSFGIELIPIVYSSLGLDEFGYTVCNESLSSSNHGFLNESGDTIVPFVHAYVYTSYLGNRNDFIVLAQKHFEEDKFAIYSSDGVRRTEYEYDEVIAIDSNNFFSSIHGNPQYYFGIKSFSTHQVGIYGALEKKVILPVIYEDICVTWCAFSKNPHFHPGPIVYTGSTPTFQVKLKDDYHLIDISGEMLFSSDSYAGWDENKKYYVNGSGKVQEVQGKCIDLRDFMSAPYVMKDSEGVFLVDDQGEPIFGDKRFFSIDKLNYSATEAPELNAFAIQSEEHELKSLFDSNLAERTPKEYRSFRFDLEKKCFFAEREDDTFDFYDTLFTKLDFNPREFTQTKPYVFFEDGKCGIKSIEGKVVLAPNYRMIESYPENRMSSDTAFYIVSDCSESVSVYNAQVEKIYDFKGDYFKFIDRFHGWQKTYLELFNKNEYSIYCFTTNTWVLKDVPCIPMNCSLDKPVAPRRYNLEPRMEYFNKKRFFWIYDFETGWTLFNDEGEELLKWNRTTSSPAVLSISGNHVLVYQELRTDEKTQLFVSNSTGDELILDGRLNGCYFIPERDRIFISFGKDNREYSAFDYHLNELNEEQFNGRIMSRLGESLYLMADKKLKTCTVFNEMGRTVIPDFRYVESDFELSGMYKVHSDSGSYMVTENSIRRYKHNFSDFTKEIIAGWIEGELRLLGNFDFYSITGKLLFSDYQIVKNANSRSSDGYFIIKNKVEELWVRNDGVVFHRNVF